MANYESDSQQRILKILMLLGGHEVDGLAPGEISASLKIAPSNVTRSLANLEIAGLAETVQDKNTWRLTPRITQISLSMLNELDKHQKKLDELKQRHTRNPY